MIRRVRWIFGVIAAFAFGLVRADAGLYISGETIAELPSQWRGFLLDHRTLRNIAAPDGPKSEAGPFRRKYEQDAKDLESKGGLSADEKADLGGIYLRLGNIDRALAILRQAQRDHPNDFRIAANLGSAWQMQGDYAQAAEALEQAVHLAPGKRLPFEQAHLRLARYRARFPKGNAPLDDLFGIRWANDDGTFTPGKISDAEWKKLPAKAPAIVQQLALWFPADGPLVRQLGELANASGDVAAAAAMFDGCVVQFGRSDPELRKRRQLVREAADRIAKEASSGKGPHEKAHVGKLEFRSRRPLLTKLGAGPLPPILAEGANPLPWELLAETTVERPFRPRVADYVKELDGKTASLVGYMQPLGTDPDARAFLLIESPVGCWYCEMPDANMIVRVELAAGTTTPYRRGAFRVIGTLALNGDDPEDYLYGLKDARIVGLD